MDDTETDNLIKDPREGFLLRTGIYYGHNFIQRRTPADDENVVLMGEEVARGSSKVSEEGRVQSLQEIVATYMKLCLQ